MKKILSILCAVAMIFTVAGCGAQEKPDAVVSKFCDAMKTMDLETMQSYIVDQDGEPFDVEDIEDEDFPASVYEILKENASQIQYTIGEVEVTEDTSTVQVDFTYPDASAAVVAATGEYISQALGMALSGADADDDAISELFETILTEKLTSADTKTAEGTLQFDCVMTDDGWRIQDVSDEDAFINILMSNIMAGFNAIENEENAHAEEEAEE